MWLELSCCLLNLECTFVTVQRRSSRQNIGWLLQERTWKLTSSEHWELSLLMTHSVKHRTVASWGHSHFPSRTRRMLHCYCMRACVWFGSFLCVIVLRLHFYVHVFLSDWYLNCVLASGAVYCTRSCLCVGGWAVSVTMKTRKCVHRSSPNWVCR